MTTSFEGIEHGLLEAIGHAKGDERGVRVHRPRPVNTRHVRIKTGMTQEQFAACFGFSVATLRHTESQGPVAAQNPGFCDFAPLAQNDGGNPLVSALMEGLRSARAE